MVVDGWNSFRILVWRWRNVEKSWTSAHLNPILHLWTLGPVRHSGPMFLSISRCWLKTSVLRCKIRQNVGHGPFNMKLSLLITVSFCRGFRKIQVLLFWYLAHFSAVCWQMIHVEPQLDLDPGVSVKRCQCVRRGPCAALCCSTAVCCCSSASCRAESWS